MARDRRVRWTRDEKLKRLAKVQLFSECTKRDLARIASLADEVEVPAGRVLMRQGEFGHECFVILDGKAEVSFRRGEKTTLGPGACFGEMALLQPRGKRSATVTAKTDMDLLVLGAREFSALTDEVPSVARKVLAAVADRVREAERGRTAH
jgi:CRP/FNR family transcriptional regulator, cyclic AMP receptor protein